MGFIKNNFEVEKNTRHNKVGIGDNQEGCEYTDNYIYQSESSDTSSNMFQILQSIELCFTRSPFPSFFLIASLFLLIASLFFLKSGLLYSISNPSFSIASAFKAPPLVCNDYSIISWMVPVFSTSKSTPFKRILIKEGKCVKRLFLKSLRSLFSSANERSTSTIVPRIRGH